MPEIPIKEFYLKRVTPPSPDIETAGVLMEFGLFPFAVCLERPWVNNQPNISCVPSGIYICKPFFWDDFNFWTWEVTGVPGRTDILFHGGRTVDWTKGCILVGERFEPTNGKNGIQDNHGLFEFLKKADPQFEDEIRLVIQWV